MTKTEMTTRVRGGVEGRFVLSGIEVYAAGARHRGSAE